MNIEIKQHSGKDIRLRLPTGLALNPVSAQFLPQIMRQNGIEITRAQAVVLVKAINRYRRSHPDWHLVEINSSAGDYVLIKV